MDISKKSCVAFCASATLLLVAIAAASGARAQALTSGFTPGDLVVSIYGDGDAPEGDIAIYTDNQASPITLNELTFTGGPVNSSTVPVAGLPVVGQLVLPQTTGSGGANNNPISGEFGSSSEGTLELSANGQYLTIAGYGVNAQTYDAGGVNFGQSYGGGTKSCIGDANPCYPLAQTSSLNPGTGGAVTVPRVIALIGATGSVDTSTALTGVFNENNPRSVATVDGTSFYISGQGVSGDTTEGLFVAPKGPAGTATAINTNYDTRTVETYNNTLYISQDSTVGAGQIAYIAQVGTAGTLPTSSTTITPSFLATGGSLLIGTGSKKSAFGAKTTIALSNGDGNSINKSTGNIYLSPENYFFADTTTLYVADSGDPKADNGGTIGNAGVGPDGQQGLSDGGLQKWSLVGGVWVLDYTLSAGLGLVSDTTACGANEVGCGTTGLIGLTGLDEPNGTVDLFATNSTLGDEDQTYVYGITDTLVDTTAAEVSGESFVALETAPSDTNIRGVAWAPDTNLSVPEPASLPLLSAGLAGLALLRRRAKPARRAASLKGRR